jgi:F-type H+-transporting ATPase subunit b
MDIQLAQIIFQAINFGLVLFVLTRFIYKPVLKLLEDRKKKVAEAAKSSNEILQEKDNLEKMKADILSKANQNAQKIENDTKNEAKKSAKTLMEKSKEELSLKEAKFTEELAKLKKDKLKSMEKELKQAAVVIAEKVLQESIDAKKHQKLIDQQIDEIIESL